MESLLGTGEGYFQTNQLSKPHNPIYKLVHNFVEKITLNLGLALPSTNSLSTQQLQYQFFQRGNTKSFHVVKIHEIPPNAAKMINIGIMKICYIYRDIRDVAMSVKRKWNFKGKKLLNSIDKAICHYYKLKNILNVLYQKYEQHEKIPHKATKLFRDPSYLNSDLSYLESVF